MVLILAYLANLAHTLVTHRDIFATDDEAGHAQWSLTTTLLVLVGATTAIAIEAEFVSGAIEAAAQTLGLSSFFLGLIVLPLVGNVTEYFTAVAFARKGQMDVAMSISLGSSIQIALMTAPALVLISYALSRPMNLVFSNPLELMAIVAAAFTVNSIARTARRRGLKGCCCSSCTYCWRWPSSFSPRKPSLQHLLQRHGVSDVHRSCSTHCFI